MSLPKGFTYVSRFVADVVEQMRYAGNNNFIGAPIDGYLAPRAVLTLEAARALENAANQLRQWDYRILVFDAYRPQRAVDHFLRWAADENDVKMRAYYYPEIDNKADILKKGYVAAKSGHSRGSTIDLTLADMEGTPLPMGTDFDWFGKRAAHGAADISAAATANRALLCRVMIEAGFRPYSEEWWHYTLKDEPYPNTYFDFPVA